MTPRKNRPKRAKAVDHDRKRRREVYGPGGSTRTSLHPTFADYGFTNDDDDNQEQDRT